MSLTREQILGTVGFPTDEIEVPFLGGTVRVTGIGFSDQNLKAYVNAPVLRPVPIPDEEPPRFKGPDRHTARVTWEMLRNARREQYGAPTAEERQSRTMIGSVVLGVIDANGERLFTWEDADWLAAHLSSNALSDIAVRVSELSDPRITDDEDTEDEVEAGKGSSGIIPD